MEYAVDPYFANFLLGLMTVLLIYWYSTRNHGYWKKRGLPFAPPLPFLGSILEHILRPLHFTELENYRKYGKIYGHFQGNRPVLSVADPELVRAILAKDFHNFINRRHLNSGDEILDNMVSSLKGEDWKRVRTIITPTFTTGKIKKTMNIFKGCSDVLVENFKAAAKKGIPVEVKSLYGAFTMDVIASSAFSTKIDSHNDPNNKFAANARQTFPAVLHWRLIIAALFPRLLKYFRHFFSTKGMDFFKDVTLQIIEERKRTNQKGNDFLQLLIDIENESVDEGKLDAEKESEDITANYGKDDTQINYKSTSGKRNLTLNELVAQCFVFFFAGYETSASTLSFASYCLALNPDVQEKLIKELDEALKAHDGELNYETIQSLKYLDNVISETLRLYPPVARLERIAAEDYKLGDTGIIVPKGMLVTIPLYAMHKDPKYYPDPEKFDPDRFQPEERAKRDQYVYLPFSSGPRNCVGMRFALLETKICLANVLSNFRFKRCPETKVPLEFVSSFSLLKPKEIKVQIEIREDSKRKLKITT